MSQAGAMSGVHTLSRLPEQFEPDAGDGGQRRPIARGQPREPFLEHCRPALNFENLPCGGQVRMRDFARSREAGAKFIRGPSIRHGRFAQVSQESGTEGGVTGALRSSVATERR